MSIEEILKSWTKRSSDTEQQKQNRTEQMIRDAVNRHPPFGDCDISVFAKGSYPNNTNVRIDSDVDIAVRCSNVFYYEKANSGTQVPGSSYQGPWTPTRLRNEVLRALEAAFGNQVDGSGNVAIKVSSSTARVDADVVPCFDYHWYYSSGGHAEGIRIYRRDNTWTENFPEQHLSEGRAKNTRTNQRYKKAVRILKRAANEMHGAGQHRDTVSYLVESLVYNCPDRLFSGATWTGTTRAVLARILEHTQGDSEPSDSARWKEADDIHYLFHSAQKWSRRDAREFAQAAQSYLGLAQ